MRDWTITDLLSLQDREMSSVKVHCYTDGRTIVHTHISAWKWDAIGEQWMIATPDDMKPSANSYTLIEYTP